MCQFFLISVDWMEDYSYSNLLQSVNITDHTTGVFLMKSPHGVITMCALHAQQGLCEIYITGVCSLRHEVGKRSSSALK